MNPPTIRRVGPGRRRREPTSVERSAEELTVHRRYVVVGRARLVTRVITEDVTFTVPLRRQEIHLEYDPLPPDGQRPTATAPTADVVEVVRHEEQVRLSTHVVPVERVRLITRVVVTDQVLTEHLSHERLDLDTDTDRVTDLGADAGPVIRDTASGRDRDV